MLWKSKLTLKAICDPISAATRLDIPLPEITFGNNLVSLKRKGKQRAVDSDPEGDTNIVFNGLDALSHVDTTGQDTIKVAYAKKWAQSRNLDNAGSGSNGEESTAVIETVKNYDWTYSTDYKGTCKASTVRGDPRNLRQPNSQPDVLHL